MSVVARSETEIPAYLPTSRLRQFYELTKPRVVALIVLTSVVGSLLATRGMPPLGRLIWGNLGIGLAAASAAALNQILDARIDATMARTRMRPLPTGALNEREALIFALLLGAASMLMLWLLVNPLTAVLTFASLIGYAVIYTLWLKRATPQNIVIGGAAHGAAPPILDHVAGALNRGGFADDAVVQRFAARLQGLAHHHRAIKGRAFLVAGEQQGDVQMGLGGGGQEFFGGHHKGGQ